MEGIKNEIKERMDVVLDCMNTLRYLGEIDTKNNPAKLFPDIRSNDVLVYNNQYMWYLCEALDRVPNITPIDFETSTDNEFKVSIYYRGVEFHTYIDRDEKAVLEDKIVEYLAKKEQEAQSEDDDNV